MFAQLARRAVQSTRNFSTSVARRGEDALPPPGDNLPFSINNRSVCLLLLVDYILDQFSNNYQNQYFAFIPDTS